MRTDGRTDIHDESIVSFLNFAEARKNASCWNGALETTVLVEMVYYCQILSLAFQWL